MNDYNPYDHMTPEERAYEQDVIAAEQHADKEQREQLSALPILAKISEGELPVTMPQIQRAFNSARVVLSDLQFRDFVQSLGNQIQQGL